MLASGLDIDLVGSEWVIVWKECVLCPETLAESKLLRIVERSCAKYCLECSRLLNGAVLAEDGGFPVCLEEKEAIDKVENLINHV